MVELVARVGALGVLVVTRVLVVASLLDLGLIAVIVDFSLSRVVVGVVATRVLNTRG